MLLNRLFQGFNPAHLFGPSDQGVVFDFTNITTMYQTNDTSTPVTATGQSIGRINDLSGKGNNATQATAASRPTYQGYGDFITDDRLETANMDLSASDKATILASVRIKGTGNQGVCYFGTAGLAGNFNMFFFAAAAPDCRSLIVGDTTSSAMRITGDTADTVNRLYTQLYDLAGAAAADESKIRKDGVLPTQTVSTPGPAGGGNLHANSPIILGDASTATTFPLNGNLHRVIVINRLLSGADLTNAEKWVGAPIGVAQ